MPTKYTKELLQPIVTLSKNWSEVCRRFGIQPLTGAQTNLTKRAKALGIDCSHFTGQGWTKGRKALNAKTTTEYLCENSSINSHKLRLRLIREGTKEAKCETCKLTKWLETTIPLELHHINGIHTDNRLENLQILCSNCHSLVKK